MGKCREWFEALEADIVWLGQEPRPCRWKLATVMTVVLLFLG